MPEGRGAGRSTWPTMGVSILFLSFAIFLLVTNIIPTRQNLAALIRQSEKVDRDIERLRSEQGRLDIEGNALQNDPFEVEKELRDRIKLTRPGEKLLRPTEDPPPEPKEPGKTR